MDCRAEWFLSSYGKMLIWYNVSLFAFQVEGRGNTRPVTKNPVNYFMRRPTVNSCNINKPICEIWGSHSGGYEEFACFMLVSCLACYSTLKMEVRCSSETLVDFHRDIWHYIPEDRTLQASMIWSFHCNRTQVFRAVSDACGVGIWRFRDCLCLHHQEYMK
jgi:hypothetical protein